MTKITLLQLAKQHHLAFPGLLFLLIALVSGPRVARAEEDEAEARKVQADESVYVAELRSFSKRHRFELTPAFTATLNNKYSSAFMPALALAYHIRENFAFEVMGGYAFSSYTALTNEIYLREGGLQAPDAERTWLQWFAGADIQWSPIYGKLRLIPGILGEFDVYILAGFGVAGTDAPCQAGSQYSSAGTGKIADGTGVQGISGTCPTDPTQAVLPGAPAFAAQLGGGFRIFFTQWLGVRLELRDIIYSQMISDVEATTSGNVNIVSTDIRNNLFVFVGLSFLL